VVVNGQSRADFRVPAGRRVRSLQLDLDGSAWIHLRSSRAITNAIHVVVDGAPFRPAPADLCYFLGWIDRVEREAGLDLGSDRAASAAAYQQAREKLYERLHAADAEGCP